MTKVCINELGRAIARSGVLPASAHYFVEYVSTHRAALKALLPRARAGGDGVPTELEGDFNQGDAAFVLSHLCFTSPEFGTKDVAARRFIPFQLGERRESSLAVKLDNVLAVRPWDRDVLAVNAADLTIDWIGGTPLVELEQRFEKLRAGVLRDMLRTLVGHMTGLADILAGMVAASDAGELPAQFKWIASERALIFRTIRRARQIARCTVRGVPEEMLWLAELEDANRRPLCRRPEIVACYRRDLRTLEAVVDPGRKPELVDALKEAQSDPLRWKAVRNGAIEYRAERTARRRASQLRRLPKDCETTVAGYYESRGTRFEEVLEQCFKALGIEILGRDDASKRGAGFPDFVIALNGQIIVIECKSSDRDNDIALGDAAEVFRKAGVHNFKSEPLVTLCHPYVATDVPRKIESSNRLTVINAEDFAEALVRLHLKKLDHARLLNWLTTPGQARYEELSY